MKKLSSPKELEALRKSIIKKRDPKKSVVNICGGTGCLALGCADVIKAFKEEITTQGLEDKVDICVSGCPGFCERGTILTIEPQNIFYQRVRRKDVAEVVAKTLVEGKVVDRLLYPDAVTGKRVIHESEVPFYTKQKRLLLAHSSQIDPESIEDYLYFGGYTALAKALYGMKPEQLIDEVKASGLRGRGGGGFPTGRKWETTRHAEDDIKYVICNCDEGDPGAFMDRSLMEGNPHSVLEGMIIGAYAIGAQEGYIYIRNEYPLAVKNAATAIKLAEECGLLGNNILGSGFNFHVKISRGGGAFVCGESTALMASLEGKVGEPRAKYVHTSEKGLWEKPSNLNNVETWANVPLIINNGAKWFAGIGTAGSKGTKIFSLVGKVRNTGLVEVPMGITLREIIFDIGGGIPGSKKFKAVQTGGPSGGFIPEKLLDLQVDFDELTRVGSMMGSGAMIVMDENNCMVDMAKYFITFLLGESCGKCLPCREGLKQMHHILTRITDGKGTMADIELVESLSRTMLDTSLCGLGYSAPNPVLTSLRYFRDEWLAHINEKRCPAKVCKALITYNIMEKCPNCGLCVKACPEKAITPQGKKKPVLLDQKKCIKCGSCYDVCKLDAVLVK
ncbi:MAG: NADH-ubiquinone oxidoreductase-F iron-sulfur binding region domain-containing protein [Dehalococcoidales bacterium]|nr:NADH-ubiquinone oxidoreductase-F iron-sulfur binding region domain-containing protein [Dehalococcoidales bacterium]